MVIVDYTRCRLSIPGVDEGSSSSYVWTGRTRSIQESFCCERCWLVLIAMRYEQKAEGVVVFTREKSLSTEIRVLVVN